MVLASINMLSLLVLIIEPPYDVASFLCLTIR